MQTNNYTGTATTICLVTTVYLTPSHTGLEQCAPTLNCYTRKRNHMGSQHSKLKQIQVQQHTDLYQFQEQQQPK